MINGILTASQNSDFLPWIEIFMHKSTDNISHAVIGSVTPAGRILRNTVWNEFIGAKHPHNFINE